MTITPANIVICDASVLINFLKVDCLDLLGDMPWRVLVTEHVRDELTDAYPNQIARYEAGIAAGHIELVVINPLDETALFTRLRRDHTLGMGECSACAVALHRQGALAIDNGRAMRKLRQHAPALVMLGTQDLMVAMIRQNLLTVAEADGLLAQWRDQHSFCLKISSFVEVI